MQKLQQQTEGLTDTDPAVLEDWDQIDFNVGLLLINRIRDTTLDIDNERLIKQLANCPAGSVQTDQKHLRDIQKRADDRLKEAETPFADAVSACQQKGFTFKDIRPTAPAITRSTDGGNITPDGVRGTGMINRPAGFTVKSTSGVFISITPPANAPKPLPDFGRPGGPLLDVGSRIETGPSSQVLLTTAGGTTITVTTGTKVKVSPPLTSGAGTAVDLEQGAVESSHTAGTPDFDDVIIRTPDGTVVPTGTRYRVERNAGGTDVSVSEGSVHLKGEAIYRLASPGQDAGKQAPATDMDLRAGDQARLVRKAEKGIIGDLVAGLKTDPWNDGRVDALIDEWLRTAVPPSKDPQVIMHYNEWAQPLSQGATSTGAPDHPADWTRYRYLWETRAKWTSANLCTLGEFIDRRVAGKSLADCAPGTPPLDLTKGNKAIEDARKELAQTEATEKARVEKAQAEKVQAEKAQAEKTRQQQLAQATPKPQPENTPVFTDLDDLLGPPPAPPVRSQPAVPQFAGAWTCVGKAQGRVFDPLQGEVISVDGGEYTTHIAIKSVNGAFTFRAETDDEQPASVNGDTLRLSFSGSTGSVHFDAEWVLSQQGMVLTGTHHHRDAHGADYVHTLRCTPSASKK